MLAKEPGDRPNAFEVSELLTSFSGKSNLRRLVKDARSRPEPESRSRPIPSHSVPARSRPPNRHGWLRGAALLAGFAIVGVAGFLFKLLTERGELIIESESADVVVAVRRDGEMVERVAIAKR